MGGVSSAEADRIAKREAERQLNEYKAEQARIQARLQAAKDKQTQEQMQREMEKLQDAYEKKVQIMLATQNQAKTKTIFEDFRDRMNLKSEDLKDYFDRDEVEDGESVIDHFIDIQTMKMAKTSGVISVVDFLKTLEMLSVLLTPAKFRKVPALQRVKNVIVFGSIGAGKSTSLNALMKQLSDRDKMNNKKNFVAKQQECAVTTDVSSIVLGDIQFIDNPGFNDPNPQLSDGNLWINLMKWLNTKQNGVIDYGFGGFVNIVSIPTAMRPPKEPFMNVAKLLMSLSIIQPSFPLKDLKNGNYPKIFTVLTGFSPLTFGADQADEDPYGQEEPSDNQGPENSPQEWYKKLKENYIKGVSECCYELFENSKAIQDSAATQAARFNQLPKHVAQLLNKERPSIYENISKKLSKASLQEEVKNPQEQTPDEDDILYQPYSDCAISKKEIEQRVRIIFSDSNFFHFDRTAKTVRDQQAFGQETAQLRKLLETIEAKPAVRVENGLSEIRIMKSQQQPFFLMQPCQLDKDKTDMVFEQLLKVLDSVLDELQTIEKDQQVNLNDVPELKAAQDIANFVRFRVVDSLGGNNSFILQKCPAKILDYLTSSMMKFQSEVFGQIRKLASDAVIDKLKAVQQQSKRNQQKMQQQLEKQFGRQMQQAAQMASKREAQYAAQLAKLQAKQEEALRKANEKKFLGLF